MASNFYTFIKPSTLLIILVLSLVFIGNDARCDESAYQTKSGDASSADGWLTAKTKTVLDVPFPQNFDAVTVRGKTGKEQVWLGVARVAVGVEFLDKDGKLFTNAAGKPLRPYSLLAQDLGKNFPDGCITLPWPARFCIRPNPALLNAAGQKKLAATWETFPAASEHEFNLEFRRDGNEFQVFFDGNVMGEWTAQPGISGCRLTLAPGASLHEVSARPSTPSPLVVLPVQEYSRVQEMIGARLEFDDKSKVPEAFQKPAGQETPGIALEGLGHIEDLSSDDLQSYFWRRNSSDNLPDQRMFSVPLATYSRARVLCARDDEPGKPNAFTLRVTRYATSRGNAMADSIVTVPQDGEQETDNAHRVGTVSYGPPDARKKAALWLIDVPIKNGLIQDLLYSDTHKSRYEGTYKYLDVELLGGPLSGVEKADAFPPPMEVVGRSWSQVSQTNGVHIFGLALEKSPAQMQVRSNVGVQAFYASDHPQFDAKLQAETAGEYSVRWEYSDMDGKIVESGKKSVALKTGEAMTVSVPVAPGNGWYAARFVLSKGNEEELVDYRTSFAMLPPDTRKAGLESPYYGWWFGDNHGSDIKLEEIGPLFQRLGIRWVGLPDDMPESKTLKQYGFTNSTMPWFGKAYSALYGKRTDMAGAMAQHEEFVRKQLKLWPSMNRMLVFHETNPTTNVFPSEIVGITPPPLQPDVAERMKFRIDYLTAMGKMMREKFPQVKLQYGNSGDSLKIVGELFRHHLPREYMDTIASEDLGQTITPERMMLGGTQDGFYLRELARKMGYGDVPVTACTEWIGRMTEKLGLREQAEWKARDGLLALAYGYDTISIAGINDAGDGYYYSIWGNGGLNERYPIMAPKPAYAAVATLTRVLDKAKFQRFIPTGSTVCYLEEFQRGGEWVYAVWTPRGERALTLTFTVDTARTLTDLYGREKSVNGKDVALDASPSAQYLVSKTRIISASAGKSTFAADKANVPEKTLQTIPLESLNTINIVSDKGRERATSLRGLNKMLEGNFEIREVEDAEMGKCVEVELKPGRELRLGETEYATLKLAKPITTTAKNAGVWIKGNGSWGDVDILKNHRGPWADNSNLHMKWPGDASLNFDGWNFIKYPYYDWTHTTGIYATTIISGLRITFPRDTLVGNERVPVENQKIRVKSIELF
jgi:hypothetical protein